MKKKLLIVELWGVGDLVIASPFVRRAAEEFEVTLLAKPYAVDLQARFWPSIKVIPFYAPWTAFSGKYWLHKWPWRAMAGIGRQLRKIHFDVAVSARWDPRDHFLMALTGARRRVGYPRVGSQMFLTQSVVLPDPQRHRYEYWRVLGEGLGWELPAQEKVELAKHRPSGPVMVHTGAGQPVRVWPLERYLLLVARIRAAGYETRVLCNPEQRDWWIRAGETAVATPSTITDLLNSMQDGGAFIGNDSGPGHLAAFLGLPTFTLFGDQVPAWFVPLQGPAEFMEGKPCPYKPCSDYCRFPRPHCLLDMTEEEVWGRVESFLKKELRPNQSLATA